MSLVWKIIATAGGVGYAPVAPGTAGAILASAVAFLMQGYCTLSEYWIILSILIVLFFFLGVVATNKLEKVWGKDPGKIVIDECIGQWLTYLFIPFGFVEIIIGLVLFRIFDISKPLFIKRLEKIPGGLGVMLDDVGAGIIANILLQLMVNFVL